MANYLWEKWNKWYRSWWIDSSFNYVLLVEKNVQPKCRKLLTKNSKCWSNMKSILVDQSNFWSWALNHKTMHIVDWPTNLVDWSTPYWKVTGKTLILAHKKYTKKLSKDQKVIQQGWETWEWHTYLLVNEIVLIHINKKCYQELHISLN